MKEHNYAFQNADTRPRLQSRTQNICFVISISAVILKRIVKITSIFGSYSFLRIALHDISSLSHHLLANWNLYIPRVAESEQRTMHSLTHRTSPCFYLSCSWRNTLWLNAMHCGKKWWIREFVAPYIFPLNPDYVAARSLRSLRSNNPAMWNGRQYCIHQFC